jgi:hypothetical protein
MGATDEQGLERWANVSPEQLDEQFRYRVIPGSMRRGDPMRDVQMAAMDLKIGGADPAMSNMYYLHRRYWEARGIDPARAMSREALTQSYVKMYDQMRRDAKPEQEDASKPPVPADNLSQMIPGAGGRAQ